jgi:hypothetical protein
MTFKKVVLWVLVIWAVIGIAIMIFNRLPKHEAPQEELTQAEKDAVFSDVGEEKLGEVPTQAENALVSQE